MGGGNKNRWEVMNKKYKLIRDTIDFECLIQAFRNVSAAQEEKDKAYEEYDGYSPDYHLGRYNDKVEEASEDLENRLIELIEKIVDYKLNKNE